MEQLETPRYADSNFENETVEKIFNNHEDPEEIFDQEISLVESEFEGSSRFMRVRLLNEEVDELLLKYRDN